MLWSINSPGCILVTLYQNPKPANLDLTALQILQYVGNFACYSAENSLDKFQQGHAIKEVHSKRGCNIIVLNLRVSMIRIP